MKQLKFTTKGQTAIEFLTTYGWALLLIGITIAVIAIFTGSGSFSHYTSLQCNIQPSFPCEGAIISAYSSTKSITFTLSFKNKLNQPIKFAANGIKLTVTNIGLSGENNYLGICNPDKASNGATVLCTVSIPGTVQPSLDTKIETRFMLYYSICSETICSGNYQSTGYSEVRLGPTFNNFYLLTLKVFPNDGYIYIQGIKYYDNTAILLQNGDYSIYASPYTGYSFSNWLISGSTLKSASSQNTTLILTANSLLTANLVKT